MDARIVQVDMSIFLWLGLALFAVLLVRAGRTVIKARDISGVVVTGDVHGSVHQTQTPSPTKEPTAKEPRWKKVFEPINVVLGIVASVLTIIGVAAN